MEDWNTLMPLAEKIDNDYGKIFNSRIGDAVGELMCDGISDYNLQTAWEGYYKCVEFMKKLYRKGYSYNWDALSEEGRKLVIEGKQPFIPLD